MDKLALVDVETTGGNPAKDRVIDIGIVLVDGGKICHEWQSLINPDTSINPFITTITGISNQDVIDAPHFGDLAWQINDLLADRVFVAHNARFDYMFIKHEFLRLEKQFTAPQLCTVRLSRKLYPQFSSHGLDALIQRFNLSIENRHRALPDAKVIYSFLSVCTKEIGESLVSREISAIIKRPSLPPQVPIQTIDSLPNTVGVYIFYDKEGLPLYVGKSLHIKDRVMTHFYDDTFSIKELNLKQRVTHIDTVVCAGELHALLTESRLVKELLPVSNRLLRHSKGIWVAKSQVNQQGYITISIENISSLSYLDRPHILALAKSKRQLTNLVRHVSEEHQLCMKLCGLEKGKGACFMYHLGTCQGACQQMEAPSDYNARLVSAFKDSMLAEWPYKAPLVVYERNPDTKQEIFFLIDHWVVLASSSILEDLIEKQSDNSTLVLDEYKILKQYLPKANAVLYSPNP